MKFKTKEELKAEDIDEWYGSLAKLFNAGINKAFNSFAERVEFYKKYQSNALKLYEEQPEVYKIIDKNYKITTWFNTYNDVLFDYCFGDMIE